MIVEPKTRIEHSLFRIMLRSPAKKAQTADSPAMIIGIVSLRLLKNVSPPLSPR